MNGTLAIPKRARPADSFSDPGPPYFRRIRYAHAIIHPTRLDVMRASQIHQVPHAFLAHSGPVTSVSRPKSTAISAAASAVLSSRGLPVARNRALALPQMTLAVRNTHADGMW